MTMDENQKEFKAGDRVRYVGIKGKPRIGWNIGMMATLALNHAGFLCARDRYGDLRMFFDDEWQHASQAPTQAPQAPSPILPSTDQLDRFEALLVRLEGILGTITKGEAK